MKLLIWVPLHTLSTYTLHLLIPGNFLRFLILQLKKCIVECWQGNQEFKPSEFKSLQILQIMLLPYSIYLLPPKGIRELGSKVLPSSNSFPSWLQVMKTLTYATHHIIKIFKKSIITLYTMFTGNLLYTMFTGNLLYTMFTGNLLYTMFTGNLLYTMFTGNLLYTMFTGNLLYTMFTGNLLYTMFTGNLLYTMFTGN